MTGRPTLAVSRTEFRRSLRVVLGNRTQLLLLGVVGISFLPMVGLGGLVLVDVGRDVAGSGIEPGGNLSVTDIVTGGAALLWIGIALLSTMRTTTTVADVDEPAHLLISTPLRNVVAGLVGAEILRLGIWVFVPTLIFAGAFAYGVGSILPVIVAVCFLALVVCSAIAVGFVPGVWIRHLLTVYEPVARYRTVVMVALGAAYFGAIFTGWFDRIVATLFDVLAGSPLGWPGQLLLAGVPSLSPSPGQLIGGLLWTVAAIPLAIGLGVVSARIHWFADPARTDDGQESTPSESSRFGFDIETLFAGAFDRPARTVAVTAIRRTKRAPIQLLYVAYPLFGSFFFIEGIVQTGTVSPMVAVLLCLYVAWGSGALFALNPLGDLGRALPTVVTSTVSGRSVVTGLVAASALLTVPIAIVVASVLGVVSPLSTGRAALLVVGTVVGAVAAPALATGVGSAFPRFGTVRLGSNREAVMPSKTAFFVYTVAIAAPAAAAAVLASDAAPELIALLVEGAVSIAVDVSVPPAGITAAAWVVLPLGVVAPFVAAWYAIRRFDRYALE